ncbi:MAG: hypothetical protein FJ008_02155 [Chloroflexi bacterium]|nr:hypothetical protein [Chloroflexota bacterium]MBM3173769.1 hypothetical protein [Chloroflexota bacterium]MBM3175283.1 hypothetical protein [Chloroflexota bacterium]MBM4450863.1 hypothetical protein [Chloroflexota bacterium]
MNDGDRAFSPSLGLSHQERRNKNPKSEYLNAKQIQSAKIIMIAAILPDSSNYRRNQKTSL